jgi:hypothetical protein
MTILIQLMTTRQISVSNFKARCTALLRQMRAHPQRLQITNRGRVIAEVLPAEAGGSADPRDWLGSLRGTVIQRPEGP